MVKKQIAKDFVFRVKSFSHAFRRIKKFFQIWSDKVKFVYYKAHGVTEGTEIMQRYGGADGTKSDGGIAYRFLITILE